MPHDPQKPLRSGSRRGILALDIFAVSNDIGERSRARAAPPPRARPDVLLSSCLAPKFNMLGPPNSRKSPTLLHADYGGTVEKHISRPPLLAYFLWPKNIPGEAPALRSGLPPNLPATLARSALNSGHYGHNIPHDRLLIIDLRHQVTQLIARRLRELKSIVKSIRSTRWMMPFWMTSPPRHDLCRGGPAQRRFTPYARRARLASVFERDLRCWGICLWPATDDCDHARGKVEGARSSARAQAEFGRARDPAVEKSDLLTGWFATDRRAGVA